MQLVQNVSVFSVGADSNHTLWVGLVKVGKALDVFFQCVFIARPQLRPIHFSQQTQTEPKGPEGYIDLSSILL